MIINFIRRFLKYKGSRLVYNVGSLLVKLCPSPRYVTVATSYGVVLVPKTFRVLSMKFDFMEPEIQETFEAFVEEADMFVNIGASEGFYVLKAKKINPRIKVIAIEPDPTAYAILRANLAINNLLDNTININVALSNKEGKTEIQTCMSGGKKVVQAKTLDAVLGEGKTSLGHKSLLLIDVEGAGVKVIKGGWNILKDVTPRIIIELHSGEEEAEDILKTLGYSVRKLSRHFIVASAHSF